MYLGALNENELNHLRKLLSKTELKVNDDDNIAWCRDSDHDFILVNSASIGNCCEICGKKLALIIYEEIKS